MRVLRRDDPLESIELRDDDAGSRVALAPARGGMVTRFFARGRDVLYLDEATLRDPTKNVRGGVPVLFPSPGKLAGDAWARGGRRGSLKQHGFARNAAWSVKRDALLELRHEPSADWPWACRLAIEHTLAGATLTLAIEVANDGDAPMPFGVGFHPYFALAQTDKAGARIPTRAARAFDNVTKRVVDLPRVDLVGREVDLHLIEHGATDASIEGVVAVRGSPEFRHWVIWTLEGKDFVCLEPWTCPGDALNTGDRVMELAPGARASMRLAIEALAPAKKQD